MERVRQLLSEPVTQENIKNLLPLQHVVTDELAEARKILAETKSQYLLNKMAPADWVSLEARVSDLRLAADQLEGLKEAIHDRIKVGVKWL